MRYSFIFFFLLISTAASAQQIQITFDYEMLNDLVKVSKNGNVSADIEKIAAKEGAQGLIKKMNFYFKEANQDSFKDSLNVFINGRDSQNDTFMFKRIQKKFSNIEPLVKKLAEVEADLVSKIETKLKQHLPKGETFKAKVFIVFSAVGGGWTFDDEPRNFYIDASMLSADDMSGIEYLSTHELLHLIQNDTRPSVDKTDKIGFFLEQAFREGMATHVADFSEIENANGYSEFSQELLKKNMRRIGTNYQLFEMLLFSLKNDPDFSYDTADQIGLSGMYDSPVYYVIYDMFNVIEKIEGKEVLFKAYKLSPSKLIEYYHSLVNKQQGDLQYNKLTKPINQYIN